VPRSRRQPKLLTGLAWLATFVALLLAGVLGRAWALPAGVPLGQTIPPPPTATPTDTVSAELTATWTSRPTWTKVATQPSEVPTATPTPVVNPPTPTQLPLPTATEVASQATATSLPPAPGPTVTSPVASPTPTFPAAVPTREFPGTPSPPLPTSERSPASPSPTAPALGPIPLAIEVAVVPQVAGPRDAVQFILQVGNVGYEPVNDVQVEVVFPNDLWLQFVACSRCTTNCPQCRGGPVLGQLTIFIGRLASGDQVIAPVHVEVADDAWPGQTLRTDWTLSAANLPAQTVQADVVLPWAQLPATGGQ
jgi:hypothetical protein